MIQPDKNLKSHISNLKKMEKRRYESPVITRISAGVTDKFGMKPRIKNISDIQDIKVTELVEKYGSPVYVLSEQTIEDTFAEAKNAFTTRYPKVQFAWSYKTNYLNAVCKIFHAQGSWAEVVSGFEYAKALQNGVSGEKIIFNGPTKSEDDLRLAIKNKSLIHIDHFDELYTLIEIAKTTDTKPRVAIRVNMDTTIYPRWDRFGFNYENGEAWTAINRIMVEPTLDLVGLHTHIGTYVMSPVPYGIAAAKLADLAVNISKKFNHHIKYIDMGGGFASKNTLKGAYLPGKDTCPMFDEYAESIVNAIFNSAIEPQHLPILIFETGRALVDDAGTAIASVIANKRMADGRRAMILNIGVNMLFTSFWYDLEIYPAQNVSSHAEDTTIYGPLCMNIDVLRAAVKFPHLQKDDIVVIPRIGAYNMTQWLQFITMRPNVVLIDKQGVTHIVREAETVLTITDSERMPEYLK